MRHLDSTQTVPAERTWWEECLPLRGKWLDRFWCGAAVIFWMWVVVGHVVAKMLDRESSGPCSPKSQISTFRTALGLYVLDNGRPPTAAQGLQALVEQPQTAPLPRKWRGPYIDAGAIAKDPWGKPYFYAPTGPKTFCHPLLRRRRRSRRL
jgi:type II secretion system protein G